MYGTRSPRRLLFQPEELRAFLANPGMRLETVLLEGGGRIVRAVPEKRS
jgi:hypothetical protein